ncbi:Nitric oxide synthase, inducible [Tetrabaena socialis]|uniref:nitric-oxide synthase (NADPH) n=1 Tax=Tetrabaena socialis TaxID=47790 RepID=A0A2J7ZMR9_9CHLO|nr:Nitric oxide synthase, inducible [Tetrabaena socialis]|eukprot:PNH01556.1 Nitric oxide synthase, inducible [Tetrabaena socialis]
MPIHSAAGRPWPTPPPPPPPKDESPLETLVREALEYQDLYHLERGNSEEVKAERVKAILSEIEATGTYYHTHDELEHGGRVAWRNAPKCSNRKFWEELTLLDYRHVDTAEGMYLACLDLLETATLSCVTTTNIVVFRAQTPGTEDGPRIWNSQLIRYAGYKKPDGSVFGEKAEVEFTQMLQDDFGYTPPAEEERTRFDVLPLLLQAHPDQDPKMFSLPPQYVARVPISHPDHPEIAELGLQWYAIPAVSSLELSVGGLTYTGTPFNGGWGWLAARRGGKRPGRRGQALSRAAAAAQAAAAA